MAAEYHTIDLDRLALKPGQGMRMDLALDTGEFVFGASAYELEERPVTSRLDISRTAAGYAMRLRFAGHLRGPCVRCLERARIELEVDSREVDQPASRDEELLSPYVEEGIVDLARWAHDALALALPDKPLCRPDCAGLCPVCGESLNDAEEGAHDHPREPDPRWAKLRELRQD